MSVEPAPSPWLADLPSRTPTGPLREDLEVDVAVVGAGYAGLSSALALCAEGLSVAVLEAHVAGFGASGRNAGHLTPTIGKDVPTLLRLFGRARTRDLLSLADTAVRHVEALLERHGIDCDYAPVGNIVAAVHPRQHGAIDRAARAAAELGMPGELLEAADLRKRGIPPAFTRGFLEPHGGHLHPGRYVDGLRRAAQAAGAALFERTPVRGVEDGERPVVQADGGRVHARYVVAAANAWMPQLGLLGRALLPLHVQLFATEPLSPAQRAALGWGGREGLYTAHEMLESYRLDADGRIVGGAKTVRYGYGGRFLPDRDPDLARRLEAVFRVRFPELSGLRVADHWGGPIALSLDFLPRIGRGGAHGRILHAASFAGHGIALASYAGEIVRDLLRGRDGPGRVLWDRRGIPLPPEPLRWLAFQALRGLFGAVDGRADRAAARGEAA